MKDQEQKGAGSQPRGLSWIFKLAGSSLDKASTAASAFSSMVLLILHVLPALRLLLGISKWKRWSVAQYGNKLQRNMGLLLAPSISWNIKVQGIYAHWGHFIAVLCNVERSLTEVVVVMFFFSQKNAVRFLFQKSSWNISCQISAQSFAISASSSW